MNVTFEMDPTYLTSVMNGVKTDVDHAGIKVGGSWTTLPIASKSVSSGVLSVTFTITAAAVGGGTVTEIALYTSANAKIGGNAVSITGIGGDGLVYSCSVSLFQIVANEENTGAYDKMS